MYLPSKQKVYIYDLFINLFVLTAVGKCLFVAGAGTGGLGLAIEGPSEAKMTCRDNRDGSCTVEYVPTEAGDYDISIKFADQFIPGSPFKVCQHFFLLSPSIICIY